MASKWKRKTVSSSHAPSDTAVGVVLHEGWCIKESGTAFLGKTNWRKRWFKLVQNRRDVLMQYYRGKHDRNPAGSVKLDVTYSTRQLESHEKPYPNCFAVGPLVDDGAVRTYYISCSTSVAMHEWMTVIDAAIQGVPEQAKRRLMTVTNHFSVRRPKGKLGRSISESDSSGSMSGLEDRGLDLIDGFEMVEDVRGASPMCSVDTGLERDELSDDELCEAEEADDDDDDDEAGAVGGAVGRRRRYTCAETGLKPSARLRLYENQEWRMEHWKELCILPRTLRWSKSDTKEGITVSRCKFGRNARGYAVIKIEGVLEADPDTVYNFLKISTRQGGKLDYIFRNETLLDELEDEPKATIIYNEFLLPLPRVSKREVVAMKIWVPQYLTGDQSCGMVMFSVDHPKAPPTQADSRAININTSGIVLKVHPGPDGEVHTHATILVRVALYGGLHRILKGAYNSGLLKLGFRTTFQHMQEQLKKFLELVDI